MVEIEVAYATPDEQFLRALTVAAGFTVQQAIAASGVLEQFSELNAAELSVGIFGKICTLEQILCAGDRIEIYRPLQHDPKEARRQRAMK